jgi:hypothetical protein
VSLIIDVRKVSCDPEVGYDYAAIVADQHIVRLHVAVDDFGRVRRGERGSGLE